MGGKNKKATARTNLKSYKNRNLSEQSVTKQKLILKSRHVAYKRLVNTLAKRNIECQFTVDEYIDLSTNKKPANFKCTKCSHIFSKLIKPSTQIQCKHCTSIGTSSLQELKLYNWLKQYIDCEASVRGILDNNSELDILVRSKNLAIEFDGLYWHSEKYGRDSGYHLNKTKQCIKKGINLIHIFEDEWYNNAKAIKFRIKHLLGLTTGKIYARKCTFRQVFANKAEQFLNKYHINGYVKSDLHYGLFYKNRLVFVLAIKKSDDNWRITRFASVFNFTVVGGLSKVIKNIKRSFRYCTLLMEVDRRWSTGNLFTKLGAKYICDLPPTYYYIKNKKRIPEFSFSDDLNPLMLGYHKIWDCGYKLFTF